MPEILPAGKDGTELEEAYEFTVERGERYTATYTGTAAELKDTYDQTVPQVSDGSTSIRSVTYRASQGRGTVVIASEDDPTTGNGVQELLGIDVIMPIYRAPYFESLTTETIAEIKIRFDEGISDITPYYSGTKEKQLFGHLVMGQTSYYETAYVLRRTYNTSNAAAVKLVANDQNTVVELPELAFSIQSLVNTLPSGEWLKRPVQCRYAARSGWVVSDEYQWAPKWSVVYGGTYTGVQ